VLHFLVANVCRDTRQLADPHRPKVVALFPAKSSAGGVAVAVRESRARPLETLDQAGRVVDGRKLEQQVYVVTYDPDLNDSGAVPFRLGEQDKD
jgi:hypothetical protein